MAEELPSGQRAIGYSSAQADRGGTAIVYAFAPPPPPDAATIAAAEALLAVLPLDGIPGPSPPPAGSRMPLSPNPLFVGREPDLRALARALKGGETVPRLDPAAYRVRAGQLALFVGPNYLVSAHQQPLPFAEHLRARALASPDLVRLDAAFMLYVVLDELFAYYELLNEHVRGEIERMEERALRDTSDRFLEDLTHFKRYVVALAQLAEQHRAIVAAYLRPDFPWVSGADVEDYFEDLDDRLRRLLDTLAGNRETVNGAFEIYVSQTAHRTNALIRVLTMVSTLLFSAAVIAAIFGASIQGLATNQPAVFVLMVACIAATAAATIRAFRRGGWL